MSLTTTDTPEAALLALYRYEFMHLLDTLELTNPGPLVRDAMTSAYAVLRVDSAHALARTAIAQGMEEACYELAEWAHLKIHGVPRTPGGLLRDREDARAALDQIRELTAQGYALDAAVAQPERQR